MRSTHYPHVRQPITIGSMAARNRVMMATHGPRLPQPRYLRYLEERARGGIGLAGFNLGPLGLMQFPFGPGRASPPGSEMMDGVPHHPLSRAGREAYDRMVPFIREWVDAVQRHGVCAVGQLYHPGAAQHSDTFQPVVSSSPMSDEFERHRAHPLTVSEIAELIEAYRLTAARALSTGVDALELHGAHGYLIQQFLSPLFNRRQDEWGGSFENRMRFPLAVLAAARAGVEDAVPIGIRLTGPEPAGGLDIVDLAAISARLEQAGAAYVSISGGSYSGLWRGAGNAYVPSALTPWGANVATAHAIRKAVSVPVMVSGAIATLEQAEEVLASGSADIVCMVRALMADPELVAKGLSGSGNEAARPCIGGNECHYGRPLACAVNPRAGREDELALATTEKARRILVVGGGPAGIECAMAAAERGHTVTLVERARELGGMLVPLARISRQARFGDYLAYVRARLAALAVDVRLECDGNAALAVDWQADIIVLATGAAWSMPIGLPANAQIDAAPLPAGPVTVIGGRDDHLGPLVVTDHFAAQGRAVTLLTECASPGQGVEAASFYAMMRRMAERKVDIRPFTAASGLRDGQLHLRHTLTNAIGTMPEPGLVIDLESRHAAVDPAAAFAGIDAECHVIGDALSPRRMVHATLDGFRLGAAL
ncbi:FAD-dependent oxidoreductase [Novosphingobium sp. MD-1]|uniref:oxidoreductase n=1 Tax=Novosphingobium sp. MD-1 TaxID=1630648 RepID=UPI00061B8D35|nr:FAD-dependent oxidoreductase [Novosphingobium sp. MD-1]GAO53563.1 NADPH-dependent 2,4-dienoyl-CoA reductase [Novosphingobium sp. MD-1]